MEPIRLPHMKETYGAPRGSEGVGGLPYYRTADREMFPGHVVPVIRSCWTFTDEERAAIARGANVELAVWGEPIQPVSLVVDESSAEIVRRIKAGEVVDGVVPPALERGMEERG